MERSKLSQRVSGVRERFSQNYHPEHHEEAAVALSQNDHDRTVPYLPRSFTARRVGNHAAPRLDNPTTSAKLET